MLVRSFRTWRSKTKTDFLDRTDKVVVLGGGSFATAMTSHVANRKSQMEVNMLVDVPIQQNYLWYGSSTGGSDAQPSGAYIFRPN